MTFAVVVVTWNARATLGACLESLAAQTDGGFEIVVVDNGSRDGTASWLREAWPAVRVVALPENVGFAEGCNRGIEATTSQWVATLNDDARPEPGWIAAHRRAVRDAGDRVGMLGSLVVRGTEPGRVGSAGVVLHDDGVFEDAGAGAPVDAHRRRCEIFCPSAAAAVYRRAMLDELRQSGGFFDGAYFAYFEDVDLGWRARLAGWEALLIPDAVVAHDEHATAKRLGGGFLERQCRQNRVRTLASNASAALLLRSLPQLWRDAGALALDGPVALLGWAGAACAGFARRSAIGRRARCPRRDVERRWATARRTPVARSGDALA